MKTKIMGIFSTLLVALMLISPAAALEQSVNVGATSNVNEYLDFSVDKNALTYDFSDVNALVNPNEGAIGMTAGGNFIGVVDVFAKLSNPSGIEFSYLDPVYGQTVMGVTDAQIVSDLQEGNSIAKMFSGKVGDVDPGVYQDTIVLTAMVGESPFGPGE